MSIIKRSLRETCTTCLACDFIVTFVQMWVVQTLWKCKWVIVSISLLVDKASLWVPGKSRDIIGMLLRFSTQWCWTCYSVPNSSSATLLNCQVCDSNPNQHPTKIEQSASSSVIAVVQSAGWAFPGHSCWACMQLHLFCNPHFSSLCAIWLTVRHLLWSSTSAFINFCSSY